MAPGEDMIDPGAPSYFRGIRIRLSLPVLIGGVILVVYYWQLLRWTPEQVKLAVTFVSIVLPLAILLPIPFNRKFLDPVVRYLKGKGNPEEAENNAALFPLRSSLISLCTWVLSGILVVLYGRLILNIPELFRSYVFVACVSAGLAASFVHFHLMRKTMESIRKRIAADVGHISLKVRYPILIKLLGSFTLLIALALVFLALMGDANMKNALSVQTQQFQQEEINHWAHILKKNPTAHQYLPIWLKVRKSAPQEGQYEQIGPEQFLVADSSRSISSSLITSLQKQAALFIVLAVITIGLISYFAADDISSHLNEIRQVTKQIAEGNFDHRVNLVTDDEVAELGQSINVMAEELRNKMHLLQQARDMAQEKSRLLEAANQELMKLDELKSNFLANISHELKAPLVSTKGYVDFILSGKLGPITEKQRKGLTVSRDNLNHLTHLITSLLDFSRLASGVIKLHREPCSLREMIDSCVASVLPEAQRKNKEIDFVIEVPPDIPPVYVDPDRIREVLLNLLTNAEKFSESGREIRITVAHSAVESDFLQVSVSDQGIGIPADQLNKIFQRFHQVDSSSTRKYGGTGLGLAIVKEILEAHGCQISVESREGVGSKFTFNLPIYRPVSPEQAPVVSFRTMGRKHHASKLVEVIEDDPNIGTIIKSLLEEEGFSVIHARNSADALAIAREHRPDLITLDIYLPDKNGFDLLSDLQHDPNTRSIPVIILSIFIDKEKGFRLGAADYLEKPIDPARLRSSIERISRQIDGENAVPKVMIVDDDPTTLGFLQDCLSSEGYQVCVHAGGKDAVLRAIQENPSMILLDLVMPDVGGLDVLKELKSNDKTKEIPVIMLTARGKTEDRDRSLMLGAQEFLHKPFDLRDIVSQVRKFFATPEG